MDFTGYLCIECVSHFPVGIFPIIAQEIYYAKQALNYKDVVQGIYVKEVFIWVLFVMYGKFTIVNNSQ
jgi:hypothetical protein